METLEKNAVENEGAFFASLKRNNKQIRDDRAISIAEDTQIVFKRKIEDLQLEIKKTKRDQEIRRFNYSIATNCNL